MWFSKIKRTILKSNLFPCFGQNIHEVNESQVWCEKKSIAFLDILDCPNPSVMYTIRMKKENKQLNFLDSHKENRIWLITLPNFLKSIINKYADKAKLKCSTTHHSGSSWKFLTFLGIQNMHKKHLYSEKGNSKKNNNKHS